MSLYVDKFELDNQEILIKDSKATTDIQDLYNKLDNKIILITDSYGDGYSPDGATTSFSQQLLNNGVIDYNLHAGGSGFVNTGNTERGNFQKQLQILTDTLTETEKLKVTKIVVLGGVNDASYSINEIKSAMSSFKTYANTNYPNAKLLVGFISYLSGNRIYDSTIKVIPAYSSTNGFIYIKNSENILYSTDLMASDLLHPNQEGQNYLATKLVDGINTGAVEVFECLPNGLQITSADGFTINSPASMQYVYIKNDKKILNINNFTVTLTGNKTLTYAGLEIGSWSSPVIKQGIKSFTIKTSFILRNPSNSQFFSAHGLLVFSADGKVLVATREGSGSGFYEPETSVLRLDDLTGDVTTLHYPYY